MSHAETARQYTQIPQTEEHIVAAHPEIGERVELIKAINESYEIQLRFEQIAQSLGLPVSSGYVIQPNHLSHKPEFVTFQMALTYRTHKGRTEAPTNRVGLALSRVANPAYWLMPIVTAFDMAEVGVFDKHPDGTKIRTLSDQLRVSIRSYMPDKPLSMSVHMENQAWGRLHTVNGFPVKHSTLFGPVNGMSREVTNFIFENASPERCSDEIEAGFAQLVDSYRKEIAIDRDR
jgi:hypothetical protein